MLFSTFDQLPVIFHGGTFTGQSKFSNRNGIHFRFKFFRHRGVLLQVASRLFLNKKCKNVVILILLQSTDNNK